MAIAVVVGVVPEIGDQERINMTFTTLDGTLADPTEVTVRVKDPDGIVTVYTYGDDEVQRVSTGVYYLDVPATKADEWTYRVEATGLVKNMDGIFTVRRSLVI